MGNSSSKNISSKELKIGSCYKFPRQNKMGPCRTLKRKR